MKRFLYLFLNFFFITTTISKEKIIYIQPGAWGDLFRPNDHDNRLEPIQKLNMVLKNSGYKLIQLKNLSSNLNNGHKIICFDIPINEIKNLQKIDSKKLVAFLWESPLIKPYNFDKNYHRYFSKIFTWRDDWIDNKKYFKLFYPAKYQMINNTVDFDKKKLCALIAGFKKVNFPNELYSERLKIINFFEKNFNKDFDFYGTNWPKGFKNYKGTIKEKADILKKYKFCICYENIKDEMGYITEKIFDCFIAGCVPVYLGAKNITDFIPENCFIDRRDFKDEFELYTFIKNINKEQYNKYITNIELFLKSKQGYLFSTDYFVKVFLDCIKN